MALHNFSIFSKLVRFISNYNVIMFSGHNLISFSQQFNSDQSCYQYLADKKWKDESFCCSKCGGKSFHAGKKPFSRKCNNCQYDESPTANTLFHKVKFPLQKAFYIVFMVSTGKKGISSYELSRKIDLRQKTCWAFKAKVMEAMKSDQIIDPLEGKVEVDEFVIGGAEKTIIGRQKGEKRLVVLGIERKGKGIARCYAKVIESANSHELGAFFDDFIAKDAQITTDKWSGYKPLMEEFFNLKRIPSRYGLSFPDLHRQIMMIKSWIRGIHHHCRRLQAYLNEYCFRFNRHYNFDNIFDEVIDRMVNHPAVFYKILLKTD